VIGAVLAMTIATAFPLPAKNSINVEIGGLLSGPSRRYVDLDKGVLLVGQAPAGARGDGAGVNTKSLVVSRTVALSKADLANLTALAHRVLQKGADGPPTCPITADRIVVLDISSPGSTISGHLYCPTHEATALVDAVFEAGER
jgi:hypothetical protein